MTRVGGGARLALVVAMALSAAACGAGASPSTSPGSSLPPVVRAVLAAGNPAAAAGQDLELVRYTIQPGTTLALHRHPGMQLAWIESGVLTYTVEVGKVTVHRVDGSTIDVRPGDTVRIVAGDWLAETESVVHFGANEGPDVVVILAASQTGQSPAIPMPSPS